jgi:hypothetical protein
LRKIFGPVQNEDGFWRIRMNHELNDLIKNADIGRYGQNGRKLLRRLKPTVGCNASKRRKRNDS